MTTHADRDDFHSELAAEAITVRIRWFGLVVGYVLVNLFERDTNVPAMNAILTLGAGYALVDTWWSYRGKVFLSEWPLVISLMEAVFIGLLCHFDGGLESPFRFFYFLSLLVCAIRHSPWITYTTFGIHSLSYLILAVSRGAQTWHDFAPSVLMLVLMGWVTWASTSLASLLKRAGRRLSELNGELEKERALLEERVSQRTRELQESQALLVQQEKQAAFGLLAAGIAHEVGNPLAGISSLVQMLRRRHEDEYTRERLQMVDDQLRRIHRTLRELVDFSRPVTSAPSLCDIRDVIEAALSIAKYYKRKKGKQIVTRYDGGLPKMRLPRDPLMQVFLNLVLNALDATAEGDTIEITTSLEEGCLKITVRDSGHGMSEKARARIFQPYFTTKSTGTGLGLFVCRRIVEQMPGGRIELTETSPEGTTFTVWLACESVRLQSNIADTTEAITPAPVPAGCPALALTSRESLTTTD